MLLDEIKKQSLIYRKNKDQMSSFMITLLSESQRPGLDDGKRESTNEEVIRVLKKFKDGAQMIIDLSPSFDSEQFKQATLEISIIENFLPKQLTEDEIREKINDAIQNGADNLGKIMGYLKSNFAGLYDGSVASKLAKELLNSRYGHVA